MARPVSCVLVLTLCGWATAALDGGVVYLGDASVLEGESFFVACVIEQLDPSLLWRKDGLPLPPMGRYLFHEDVFDKRSKVRLPHAGAVPRLVRPCRLVQRSRVTDLFQYTLP